MTVLQLGTLFLTFKTNVLSLSTFRRQPNTSHARYWHTERVRGYFTLLARCLDYLLTYLLQLQS